MIHKKTARFLWTIFSWHNTFPNAADRCPQKKKRIGQPKREKPIRFSWFKLFRGKPGLRRAWVVGEDARGAPLIQPFEAAEIIDRPAVDADVVPAATVRVPFSAFSAFPQKPYPFVISYFLTFRFVQSREAGKARRSSKNFKGWQSGTPSWTGAGFISKII